MSLRLSNGFVLPEGKVTPNALFVGGIDVNVRSVDTLFKLTFAIHVIKSCGGEEPQIEVIMLF